MKRWKADSQKIGQIFKIILPPALFPALLFLTALIIPVPSANGQESTQEPYISLSVRNQPLGDVLNKIARETGYTFKLEDEWKGYPVNASIQNLPLNQGLKRILTSLNHAIIYESEKKIQILVYGKTDAHQKDSHLNRSSPPPDPGYLQESAPPPEPISEDTGDARSADESAEETETVGEMVETPPSNQESSSPTENSDEPRENAPTPTDASSESAQNQN
jgi:hypothetical protein